MQFDAKLMHLVTCHVINNLTSLVVLGIDWLTEHQPEIDGPNYIVIMHLANGKRLLILGLAAGYSKPIFIFCSSKVACKSVAKGSMHGLSLFHLTILQHVCIELNVHRQTSYQCTGKMVSLLSKIVGNELSRNLLMYLNPLDHRYSGILTIILT